MKIKTFAEYSQELAVNEVGEASLKGFSYSKILDELKEYYLDFKKDKITKEELIQNIPNQSQVNYRFKTDKGTYICNFTFNYSLISMKNAIQKFGKDSLIFDFSFTDEKETIDTVLNRGEMFRIMSTVTTIIKEFLEDYPYAIVDYYAVDGDPRRYNMYKQYVEKQVGKDYEYTEMKILGELTLFIQNKKYK